MTTHSHDPTRAPRNQIPEFSVRFFVPFLLLFIFASVWRFVFTTSSVVGAVWHTHTPDTQLLHIKLLPLAPVHRVQHCLHADITQIVISYLTFALFRWFISKLSQQNYVQRTFVVPFSISVSANAALVHKLCKWKCSDASLARTHGPHTHYFPSKCLPLASIAIRLGAVPASAALAEKWNNCFCHV